MLARVLVGVALLGVVAIGSPHAPPSEPSVQAPEGGQPTETKVQIPGTTYEVDFGMLRSQPGAAINSRALLKAIGTWLSTTFDLPATDSLPAVALASKEGIALVAQGGALSDSRREGAPAHEPQILALYDASARIIYLPEGWVGGTPAELAMLVHEMVHHLQHAAGLTFACAQEREALAYAAQRQWGVLFGRDVDADLGLDPFRTLLISSCIPY